MSSFLDIINFQVVTVASESRGDVRFPIYPTKLCTNEQFKMWKYEIWRKYEGKIWENMKYEGNMKEKSEKIWNMKEIWSKNMRKYEGRLNK